MLLAIALVSLLAASGCLGSVPVECGSDESCFADAVSSCAKATVKTATKEASFGVIDLRYILSASIEGKDGDYCVVENTFEEIEMIGNLTMAPSNLIFHLYSLTGSPITCRVSAPFSLDIDGINSSAGMCSGNGLASLLEALRYRYGEPPQPPSFLDIREAYCVGGERIVVYVRNDGLSDVNLSSDVELIDTESGQALTVGWKDFSGAHPVEILYPLKLAQTDIYGTEPGKNYTYEITLGGDLYPFFVQC